MPVTVGDRGDIATLTVSNPDCGYESALGAAGATTPIEISKVADPALLDAVTVYRVEAAAAVGVPLIWPVEEFRVRPAGSAGATE